MPFDHDPYRTLGLAPGASLNEIRSAYRRLAKKYHPDAAGDRALPRFLSIQAAYERLVDGEGRLRRPGSGAAGTGTPGGGGGRGSSQEPWRSDASRARASREAWRARRGGGSGAGAGPAASGSASGSGSGSTRGGGDPGRTGGRRARGEHDRRHARRATAGSTTYDEAAETPFDPEWDGGAWYGPSSGTYWTINPREYADPRKHGPEYQARAWRAAGLDEGIDEAGTAPGAGVPVGFGAPAAADDPPSPAGPVRPDSPGAPSSVVPPLRDIESIVRRLGPRSLLARARRIRSR